MSGSTHPLPPYAFMAWTKNLYLIFCTNLFINFLASFVQMYIFVFMSVHYSIIQILNCYDSVHYTGWSKSLYAPDDCTVIVRCKETFWSLCTKWWFLSDIVPLCVSYHKSIILTDKYNYTDLIYRFFIQHCYMFWQSTSSIIRQKSVHKNSIG